MRRLASLVLTGLMNSFDLASALIQIFWICISSIGILIRVRPNTRQHDHRRVL